MNYVKIPPLDCNNISIWSQHVLIFGDFVTYSFFLIFTLAIIAIYPATYNN